MNIEKAVTINLIIQLTPTEAELLTMALNGIQIDGLTCTIPTLDDQNRVQTLLKIIKEKLNVS